MARFAVYGAVSRDLLNIVEAESFRDASMMVLKRHLDAPTDFLGESYNSTVEEWCAETRRSERDVYEMFPALEITAKATPSRRLRKKTMLALKSKITRLLDIGEMMKRAEFDIESIRENGISYADVTLSFDRDDDDWYLKRNHSDHVEFIAWTVHTSRSNFLICKPSTGHVDPFVLANVIDGGLTEEEAVHRLGELGRQATAKAA